MCTYIETDKKENLKRFLLFVGGTYYPAGGFDDFVESFDTQEEAHEHIASKCKNDDWAQIIDTGERK